MVPEGVVNCIVVPVRCNLGAMSRSKDRSSMPSDPRTTRDRRELSLPGQVAHVSQTSGQVSKSSG